MFTPGLSFRAKGLTERPRAWIKVPIEGALSGGRSLPVGIAVNDHNPATGC